MSNNPESAQFQISYNAAAFARAIGRNCSSEWAPNLIWEVIQLRDKALATKKYTGSLKKTKSAMLMDMELHWKELDSGVVDEPKPLYVSNEFYKALIGVNSVAKGDSVDESGSTVDTRGYPSG